MALPRMAISTNWPSPCRARSQRQPLYGCGRHHRGQMVDVLRRAAESGAIEQMPRTCAIPLRRLDRRKIAHPIVFRSHRAVPEISSDRPLSSATIYTAFPLGAHIPSAPLKRRVRRPSVSIFPTRGARRHGTARRPIVSISAACFASAATISFLASCVMLLFEPHTTMPPSNAAAAPIAAGSGRWR